MQISPQRILKSTPQPAATPDGRGGGLCGECVSVQMERFAYADAFAAVVEGHWTSGFHMLNMPLGLCFQIQACSE